VDFVELSSGARSFFHDHDIEAEVAEPKRGGEAGHTGADDHGVQALGRRHGGGSLEAAGALWAGASLAAAGAP
jgi:hypothetical protein